MYRKLLLLLMVCVPLSCGFHLRGAIDLPSYITPLYVEHYGPDNTLSRELRNLLSQSAASSLAESRDIAAAELEIISAQTRQRVVAVDNRGRVRQYELSYRVSYRVTLKQSSADAIASENIRVVNLKRDLLFDPDSVLAIGHEQQRLYDDMRKDAASMILRQLKAMGQTAVK